MNKFMASSDFDHSEKCHLITILEVILILKKWLIKYDVF